VAGRAQALPLPLHPDELFLAQLGRALVPRDHDTAHTPGQLRQCSCADRSHRELHRTQQREPKAIHLDKDGRPDHRQGPTWAGGPRDGPPIARYFSVTALALPTVVSSARKLELLNGVIAEADAAGATSKAAREWCEKALAVLRVTMGHDHPTIASVKKARFSPILITSTTTDQDFDNARGPGSARSWQL